MGKGSRNKLTRWWNIRQTCHAYSNAQRQRKTQGLHFLQVLITQKKNKVLMGHARCDKRTWWFTDSLRYKYRFSRMYLLQCRIRVMLLCRHDKKSWDYWHSYLKPTTTTGRTSPLTVTQRSVLYACTHCYLCVYACRMCMWCRVIGESCFLIFFFWKF